MNKNIIYILIALVVGLLGGWLIFGGSDDPSAALVEGDHQHTSQTAQKWTCSMHPQIMQDEPGDCPICGMDLVPAATVSGALQPNEIKMTDNAVALANIQTTRVGGASVERDDNTLSISGTIEANEENQTIQASYFKGRVEQLYVNFEGQQVRKGQLLARIYAPELVAAQQELITAAALKESQPALYQAVRNKLKLWKLSASQINRIEASGKVQESFPIYTTVAGTVTEKLVAEGDYVNQGQPLVKLSNLNNLWAEFDVYESQIALFEVGQQIQITTNAYPNKQFQAEISFIDPVLNTQTRTISLRASLNNNNGLLKPGMFVTGKVAAPDNIEESMLSIPASAVLWTGERSVVYVQIGETPIFEMKEIELGRRTGDRYQVISGLEVGEQIVTNGAFTVDAAAQLQGKRSMMNRALTAENTGTTLPVSSAFQQELIGILPLYLKLKNAFVSSDVDAVSAFAKANLKQMKAIDQNGIDVETLSYLEKMISLLEKIEKSDALEVQRDHFILLNEHLVILAQNLEGLEQVFYVQQCPMANKNKGAVWLSADAEIRNPYYGDAMLTCGSVTDTIK